METIIVKVEGENLRALKAFLSALNIKFEKDDETSYEFSEELENKIKKARAERQRGEVITVTSENLWESI
ncbi:DUF2683 family protein [Dyadobacter tibetensis]|uniref:DUF2683 family protein n=1 Tax=Dyadobacter tibetensis TaxID=1211851 RepID=UPI0004724812|nr:DUF2683 family protein [Dyadobacter tibetensis]